MFGTRSQAYSFLHKAFLLLLVLSALALSMYGVELYFKQELEEAGYSKYIESVTDDPSFSASTATSNGRVYAHFGRVYLLGDSMIKTFLPAHFFGETFDWVDYTPVYTKKKDWYYLIKFRYKDSEDAVIKSSDTSSFRTGYLLGNFISADVIAEEMFKNFKPNYNDILVVLYGAHSYFEQYEVYKDFIQNVYDRVALRFPGQTFWYEPFPQHFSSGIFDHTRRDPQCYPLSKEGKWNKTLISFILLTINTCHLLSYIISNSVY